MGIFVLRDLGSEKKNTIFAQEILLENYLYEIESQLNEIDVSKAIKELKSRVKIKNAEVKIKLFLKFLDGILSSELIDKNTEIAIDNLTQILMLDQKAVGKLIFERKCEYVTEKMELLIADKKLSNDDVKKIESLEKGLKLDHEEIVNCYSKVAGSIIFDYINTIISDKLISPEEDEKLKELCSDLNANVLLTDEQNKFLDDLKFLWRIKNNQLDPIEPDIQLQASEKLYLKAKCDWFESRKKTVGYAYGGLSKRITIAKGVSFRLGGGSAQRISEDFLTLIDSGFIYVTNKRLLFVSEKGAKNISVNKILSFQITQGGVKVIKETGKSPVLSLNEETMKFAGVLSSILGWGKDFVNEYTESLQLKKFQYKDSLQAEEEKYLNAISKKNKGTTALLALFFGYFGIHSFYAGRTGRGIAQLILCFTGISLVWGFIDFIIICTGHFKDGRGNYIT